MGEVLTRNRPLVIMLLIALAFFGLVVTTLEPRTWVSILLSGLTLAALYFLVASGLSLIFGLMHVLSLAHGSLFMLGAYAGWTFYTRFQGPPSDVRFVLALLVGAAAGGLVGALIEVLLIRPLYARPLYQMLALCRRLLRW